MKIATVKQECSDGDKATITGTVGWVSEVKSHEGQEGTFRTQSLLVSDGEQTDDKRNSIFCGFYADKGTWNHLKGNVITLQGTINEYQGKKELRSCKIKDSQPAPQKAPQAPSQPPQGNKDRLIVAQVVYKVLAEACNEAQGWDVWLMSNQLVFKKHVDFVMQIGMGKEYDDIPF